MSGTLHCQAQLSFEAQLSFAQRPVEFLIARAESRKAREAALGTYLTVSAPLLWQPVQKRDRARFQDDKYTHAGRLASGGVEVWTYRVPSVHPNRNISRSDPLANIYRKISRSDD